MAKANAGVPVSFTMSVDSIIELMKKVDRLEAKINSLEEEVQSNFDILAEYIPQAVDGGVKLKTFVEAKEDYEDIVVARAS